VKQFVQVSAGGVLGSLARYGADVALPNFPLAILIANLLGVAIAGYFGFRTISLEERAFWVVGVAGGMTTFSSVALIHGENNGVISIAYFYGMVAASLLLLNFLKARVRG
jgi:fluoride ion exporter CrcB/FEX